MAETKKKKVEAKAEKPTRVSLWLWNEMKDAQEAARKALKPEPSYVELLDDAWVKSRASADSVTPITGTTGGTRTTSGEGQALPPLATRKEGDIIHTLASEISEPEGEFLRECLRIYRSPFQTAITENIKYFGVGLAASQIIAELEAMNDQFSTANAGAISPAEQGLLARFDHAENEAALLSEALRDVIKKLRRDKGGDLEDAG